MDTSQVEDFETTIKLYKGEDDSKEEESSNTNVIIVVGIFVVLIAGFAGLVIASKK